MSMSSVPQSSGADEVSEAQMLSREDTVVLTTFILGFFALGVFRCPLRRHAKKHEMHSTRSREYVDAALHSLTTAFEAIKACTLALASFRKRFAWTAPTCDSALASLPPEINAEVARCLSLQDLAALSTCTTSAWHNFGEAPEVWGTIANDRNVDILSSWTSEPREAFRSEFFRTDGQRLERLGSEMPGVGGAGYTAVLTEAARLARGLMPSDGRQAWEATCRTAERALHAHNPANKEATAAATEFLQVVRHRRELVGSAEVDRLEDAYNSALQLQAFMDVAMDENLEDMESVSGRSEVSTSSSTQVSVSLNESTRRTARCGTTRSPRLVERSVDSALEDMHEMQRHCELDAMLEELRLQTESARDL